MVDFTEVCRAYCCEYTVTAESDLVLMNYFLSALQNKLQNVDLFICC